MQDVYHQYNDFEILSICIDDELDSVKVYARLYDFLFLIDGNQVAWALYFQSGFTPIYYVLEPDVDMTVHEWVEASDTSLLRQWIEECIEVEEQPDLRLASLKVGPNPTDGSVFISGAQHPFTVEIYNVEGRLVDKTAVSKKRFYWDGRRFSEGVYLFRIRSGNECRLAKVAVIR